MPQDFLPYDIYPGQDLDATKVQRNFEAIEAKFPLRGRDVSEVFATVINWAGATIPTEAINIDELFNQATDIAAALGCLDVINGMRLTYASPTTFRVDVGHVLHRAEFKILEDDTGTCHDDSTCFGDEITPGDALIPGECEPTEGNPSGLDFGDGTLWYYVYAKMDNSGRAPEVRVSAERPVWCPGYGPEHPDNNRLRYIGALKTIAAGELRPWMPYSNGWTIWAPGDWLQEGTDGWDYTGTFVRFPDGPLWIPPTADAARIAAANTYGDGGAHLHVRPCQEAPFTGTPIGFCLIGETDRFIRSDFCSNFCEAVDACAAPFPGPIVAELICDLDSARNSNDSEAVFDLPVNMCNLSGPYRQTFEYRRPEGGENPGYFNIDVVGYHEPYLR